MKRNPMLRLEWERRQRGWTQASKVGISQKNLISAFERGRLLPGSELLERFAQAFLLSPASVLLKPVRRVPDPEEVAAEPVAEAVGAYMTPMLDNVRRLHALGLNTIPLKPDSKQPAGSWERYQQERVTDAELMTWFGNGHRHNVGNVCGRVSNIIVVETDKPEHEAWAAANCRRHR